jgi:hypothetical protein
LVEVASGWQRSLGALGKWQQDVSPFPQIELQEGPSRDALEA